MFRERGRQLQPWLAKQLPATAAQLLGYSGDVPRVVQSAVMPPFQRQAKRRQHVRHGQQASARPPLLRVHDLLIATTGSFEIRRTFFLFPFCSAAGFKTVLMRTSRCQEKVKKLITAVYQVFRNEPGQNFVGVRQRGNNTCGTSEDRLEQDQTLTLQVCVLMTAVDISFSDTWPQRLFDDVLLGTQLAPAPKKLATKNFILKNTNTKSLKSLEMHGQSPFQTKTELKAAYSRSPR